MDTYNILCVNSIFDLIKNIITVVRAVINHLL